MKYEDQLEQNGKSQESGASRIARARRESSAGMIGLAILLSGIIATSLGAPKKISVSLCVLGGVILAITHYFCRRW